MPWSARVPSKAESKRKSRNVAPDLVLSARATPELRTRTQRARTYATPVGGDDGEAPSHCDEATIARVLDAVTNAAHNGVELPSVCELVGDHGRAQATLAALVERGEVVTVQGQPETTYVAPSLAHLWRMPGYEDVGKDIRATDVQRDVHLWSGHLASTLCTPVLDRITSVVLASVLVEQPVSEVRHVRCKVVSGGGLTPTRSGRAVGVAVLCVRVCVGGCACGCACVGDSGTARGAPSAPTPSRCAGGGGQVAHGQGACCGSRAAFCAAPRAVCIVLPPRLGRRRAPCVVRIRRGVRTAGSCISRWRRRRGSGVDPSSTCWIRIRIRIKIRIRVGIRIRIRVRVRVRVRVRISSR